METTDGPGISQSPEIDQRDRRKFQRSTPGFPLSVRWANEVPGAEGGDVQDISEGGFCFLGGTPEPVGSYARVYLSTSGQNELELMTRIVWRKTSETPTSTKKIGVMVLERNDIGRYKKIVDLALGSTPGERRIQERRETTLNQGNVTRSVDDRRGLPGIARRLFMTGQSLDRWISRYTYERSLKSASSAKVKMDPSTKIMLGSNNYLGLTDHPRVKEAALKAIMKYGTGAGGVRVLSGTMDLHKQLEERLAQFKHTESCLIFPSGYVANLAVLTAIAEEGDVFLSDEVNHASIVDGCRASKGTVRFYKHCDLENLEKKLSQYGARKPKMIITDGVFSMDGDVAPVDKILALAKKYNAMLMVDDAHATGVVGQTGRGSAEHCGVLGQVDITTVTLSKALGAIGGAICGSRNVIKRIFNLSRPFIFTSALPPSVCASVMAAIDVIESEPGLVQKVKKNRDILCSGLRKMGYRVPPTESAVIPVIIGNEVKTYQLASRLDELNVFVNAVSRPAVPREYSRLRISVMATHTEGHLEEALTAFRQAGEELGLIKKEG